MTQVNNNTNSSAGKHLTYEERIKIEAYKELDYSKRKIADVLGRAAQTINNAINQGTSVRLSNAKSTMAKYMNTSNIPIQPMLIMKYIFATGKTVDGVPNGYDVIHLQAGQTKKC